MNILNDSNENLYIEKITEIIEKQDILALRKYMEELEPADVAEVVEELDEELLHELTELMDEDDLASLMEESDDKMRIQIAKSLNNQRLLVAFQYMQKDDIVDMLGDFPIGRRKEVINLMKADERKIITTMLEYPEDSAGGIMSTAYIALKEDLNIAKGLEKIREIGPKTEVIETIYVINDRRELVGCVDLRKLLAAKRDDKISDIMDAHCISIEPETDQEEAANLVSKYDLNAIPVVSKSKQILGIITVDDVIDVIVEEYNEDMLQMAGVSKEESLDSRLGSSIRMRLPWLLVNLITAFLASFTVKLFESTIEQVVSLSAIMTIVSGMGGNAGSQTMSIMVRQLATDKLKWSKCVKPFLKELLLGVVNGAATGLVTGIIVYFMYGNIYLGLIVLIAMIGNLVIAGIFGFLVPYVLDKFHADPAVSSSIFVTTATDVLGFFIFLGLARLFLQLLI